uniref:J domain-containing protein n=1 Tax=Glossina austeni TaxID=7395 RepID=A0A1A9UHF0_GLOAU
MEDKFFPLCGTLTSKRRRQIEEKGSGNSEADGFLCAGSPVTTAMNLSELDYYTILNVNRSATKGEIYLAYRKLAIRLNPYRDPKHCKEFVPLAEENQLTHMSPLDLTKQWAYINMALDVLGAYSSGNDLYRSIYDRYGEAGLMQGILLPNGYFPPYNYHGDHMKVYHEVFGTYSPYANIMDPITNPPPLYTNKNNGIGVRTKEPPVEKTVALSLEDVYFGCVKLMHVWRQEFIDKEELTTEKRKKTLTLNMPPGITAGTRFSFKEEGDRFPTKIPSDIIFIVEDKPHDVFKRRNLYNIVYTHHITLCQALTGFRFIIETLDKRKIKVSISDVVTPDYIMSGIGQKNFILKTYAYYEKTYLRSSSRGPLRRIQ